MSRRNHRHGTPHARSHRVEAPRPTSPASRVAPIAHPEPAEAATPPSIRPEPVLVDTDRSDVDRLDVGRAQAQSLPAAMATAVGPPPMTASIATIPAPTMVEDEPEASSTTDPVDGPIDGPFRAAGIASVDGATVDGATVDGAAGAEAAVAETTGAEAAGAEAAVADRAFATGSTGPLDVPSVRASTCTTAQLRRFIKSRAYMPMHELRRRFLIDGSEDDVTLVEVGGGTLCGGRPARPPRMLGDLLRGGEVGYELSHDPVTPIVVGVFPMRPIPRP